jgi:hypothetical protein
MTNKGYVETNPIEWPPIDRSTCKYPDDYRAAGRPGVTESIAFVVDFDSDDYGRFLRMADVINVHVEDVVSRLNISLTEIRETSNDKIGEVWKPVEKLKGQMESLSVAMEHLKELQNELANVKMQIAKNLKGQKESPSVAIGDLKELQNKLANVKTQMAKNLNDARNGRAEVEDAKSQVDLLRGRVEALESHKSGTFPVTFQMVRRLYIGLIATAFFALFVLLKVLFF